MIENVHERIFPGADPAEIAALIDGLGQPDDRLWPGNGRWPAMEMSGPLAVLPHGGHGIVRYTTSDYRPGETVTFRFDDGLGLDGVHRFDRLDTPQGPGLRHTISARTYGSMRLGWPLAVRWLHDQCLEDLLDTAAARLGADVELSTPSLWVRFLLKVGPSPEKEMEMLRRRG